MVTKLCDNKALKGSYDICLRYMSICHRQTTQEKRNRMNTAPPPARVVKHHSKDLTAEGRAAYNAYKAEYVRERRQMMLDAERERMRVYMREYRRRRSGSQ